MKRKIFALLAVLSGLLAGCTAAPESEVPAPEPTVPAASMILNLYCFQAGKADAFLLWNEAGAVLIDTGESGFGKTILTKLEELSIRKLDCLIITHFDKDHVGGAKKILTELQVDRVLQSNCPKTGADAYEKYLEALAEQGMEAVTVRDTLEFSLGDAVFIVDPPLRAEYSEKASNNSSLIVTVTHGEKRLVFLGDAQEQRLVEYLAQNPPACDLLKVPYHGHNQNVLPELFQRLRPAAAVITSSEEEPEDAETLRLLEQQGTQVYLTREAPVQFRSDGKSLILNSHKNL